MKIVRWILSAAAVAAVAASCLYGGVRYGRYFERHKLMFGLSDRDNTRLSLRRVTGALRSRSQFEQDLWVMMLIPPGQRFGYYVDVGAADGERISNTKLFDDMGWKGVCIDPFATHMEKRTCQVFRQPVYRTSGVRVLFNAIGDRGGIIGPVDAGVGPGAGGRPKTPVEQVPATLDEILAKAGAPSYIDYISLDIEGAEYDALLGLSLDRYQVGAFTIEHNFETGKREAIRRLLESKGYVRVQSWVVDDFYVNQRLAGRFRPPDRYSTCLY
jgi:FkbM family methyltransferase